MSLITAKRSCADALALFSLSLDQELGHLGARRLERHLLGCADCRRKSSSIEANTLALRSLPLEAPSVSLMPSHLPWRRRIARTGLPAAAAMIASALALVALQGSVDAGSGGMSRTTTVSNAVTFSPVTHSLPPQSQQQSMNASLVWVP